MTFFVLILGCEGSAQVDPPGGGGDDPRRDTGVETAPGDTSPDPIDTSRQDTGPDTGDQPDDYDGLYQLERVIPIDITLSDEARRDLQRDPKEYVQGSVVVDGEAFGSVGIRLKGSGSFQTLSGKAAFKIDFNRYDPDQSYHGKGKFTLNNMLHDETQVHEAVAHAAFRAAGLPGARVGYAWVTVNGDDYGLYANVETYDRDFLDENFNNREGNLYEGGYPYYPDSYDHADFTRTEVKNFDLESGTDMDFEDLKAVVTALKASEATFDVELSTVVDLDQYARFQIMESWTGQWDGYAFASNNWRVYVDHGGTGLLYMVPSGLDYCFTTYYDPLDDARSPLGRDCQANPDCNARFADVMESTLDAVDNAGLEALMDETYALVRPYVDADPRNNINERNLDSKIETMREWIQGRSTKVRNWYR
jgi:spore coat protein CotH